MQGDTVRFRLLEMLREFGEAQMTEAQNLTLTQRHAAYFLHLAEHAEPHLTGPEQARWLHCLADEQDNLRLVLRGSGSSSQDSELRLRLAAALWRLWSIRGPLDEGRQFLERMLENAGALENTAVAARALNGLAVLTRRQGDLEAAEAVQYRCLALWRILQDTRGIASCLNNLGTLTTMKGDFLAAQYLLEESLALWREIAQPLSIAQTLNNLGYLAKEQGKPQKARQICIESLGIFRHLNNPQGKTLSLSILSATAVSMKDYETALPFCREVLEIASLLNDSQTIVTCLQTLAEMRFYRGSPLEAAKLLGCAGHLRAQIGSFQDRRAQIEVAQLTETVRITLPPAEFTSAWAAGNVLTLKEAVAFAFSNLTRTQ
ncbi:MAG: tetratricopeptide repeat protein [Janthinobacterium lividum]